MKKAQCFAATLPCLVLACASTLHAERQDLPPAVTTAPVARVALAMSATVPGAPVVPSHAAQPIEVSPALQAVVDASDRNEADRALDKGRHPGELLTFLRLSPGMKVADLGAAGGYTTELLARAVGPAGKVYGQNPKFVLERFAEKPWKERLALPVMKNVVRVDREFSDPLPPEARNLDAVVMVLFYHDTVWLKVDRDAMNHAVLAALKPGGVYAIVDHSGRAGTGITETQSLHRIEETVVRAEVERAGFHFDGAGDFLRNPADPCDWNDAPGGAGGRRGTSDRFALRFVKP